MTTDNVNIRSAPELDPANLVGQALEGERYVVVGEQEGWIQIEEGYISSDYATVSYALDEAENWICALMAVKSSIKDVWSIFQGKTIYY